MSRSSTIQEVSRLNKTEKKSIIYHALAKEGFNQYQVSKLLEVDRSHINRIAKKEEQGLLAPLVNVYKRNLKALAKGQKVGEMNEIKGSDVLGALKEIGARIDPVINKQEIRSFSAHLEITGEDRDRLLSTLGIIQSSAIQPLTNNVTSKVLNNNDSPGMYIMSNGTNDTAIEAEIEETGSEDGGTGKNP